jgi:hypothetical protein
VKVVSKKSFFILINPNLQSKKINTIQILFTSKKKSILLKHLSKVTQPQHHSDFIFDTLTKLGFYRRSSKGYAGTEWKTTIIKPLNNFMES